MKLSNVIVNKGLLRFPSLLGIATSVPVNKSEFLLLYLTTMSHVLNFLHPLIDNADGD